MGDAIFLSGCLAFFLLLHLPIYLCHRRNRIENRLPNPAIAFILSFVPSPLGGILYVNGLFGAVPCLAVLYVIFSKVPGSADRDGDAYILGYLIFIMAVASMCSAVIMRISRRLIAMKEAKQRNRNEC
jgi:hypothetical protein